MVIDDGERMHFLASDLDRSFVVALPKLVGGRAFEGLNGRNGFFVGSNTATPPQDVGNGSNAGERVALVDEIGSNFSRAPSELLSDLKNALLKVVAGSPRRMVRAPGLIN